MAYTDEATSSKLSALNETQESIVTVAQWIMFHRRHADRSASVWLQKLKDSPVAKRLVLIYLANEVVQQSKARKKDDFLIAFSPIIAEATATAYKGAIGDVQGKLKRVVEVWRQRQIFETTIQDAIEARLGEIDKARSSGKKPLLGGFLFGSTGPAAPTELQPLIPLQTAISKAALGITNASSATADYNKHMDPSAASIPPPVYAARLSGLLKTLANAEGAVSESIKARKALIEALEKLARENGEVLAREENLRDDLEAKRATTEGKKRDVEDEILRKLPSESPADGAQQNGGEEEEEYERPQMEELTPPPVEEFTPVGSPKAEGAVGNGAANVFPFGNGFGAATRAWSGSPDAGPNKRARIDEHQDLVQGDGMADLDEDVAELLRQESGAK